MQSTNEAASVARTTYERYLRTDELLALQKPRAERLHADELIFQVVHQSIELWWKVTGELLDAAHSALEHDDPLAAATALRRASAAQTVVFAALRQLEALAPSDFLTIRAGLEDGSGADSPGFRQVLRAAPPLEGAYLAAVQRAGTDLLTVYAEPGRHAALYACAECLVDFDEQFHLFRALHLKLAERHLGSSAIGTGGTPLPLLARTLRDVLFPAIWEVRTQLLAQRQARPTGHAG